MRRVAAAGLAFACALAGAPARAQDLAYDLDRDLFVSITGGSLWIASEAQKAAIAPAACRWCSTNALDDAVRRALVWSPSKIGAADAMSNVLGYGLAPLSAVGLVAIAAWHDGRTADIAVDLLVVAESTVVGMDVNQVVKFATGRQRPFVHFHTGAGTPSDDDLSFFSGHTTAAFCLATASGTVASLRGYRWAPWVWAQGMVFAALTGYLRIAADKHYFSDVITGAVFGSAVGFALPYFVHRPRVGARPAAVVLRGSAGRDGGSLGIAGPW